MNLDLGVRQPCSKNGCTALGVAAVVFYAVDGPRWASFCSAHMNECQALVDRIKKVHDPMVVRERLREEHRARQKKKD